MNKESSDYEEIMFYPNAVFRATRNLEHIQQGQVCIVDYNSLSINSVYVYVAPSFDSVSEDAIANEAFRTWKRASIRKTPGYIYNWKGHFVRRNQFPIANYIALTIHKLMGDTFNLLATAISSNNPELGLWLISQIYVLVSRVKHLHQLFFVGSKTDTMFAVERVLLKRNLHEERLYEMFLKLKNAANNTTGPTNLEAPLYLRNHFTVPETKFGYVYILVSVKDKTFQTLCSGATESSLSDELRRVNSTDASENRLLFENQPWAMGFFYWNFANNEERHAVFETCTRILSQYPKIAYDCYREYCNFDLRCYSNLKCIVCGKIVRSSV